MNADTPSQLSDDELMDRVSRLARGEREATASLIAHLSELYGRRLHERAGFSSLFTYCLEVLRLSEHEAYDRMKAAKVVRRYPHVLALLASGRVNLTTVRLLAPHLTIRNHEELLAAARDKSKREVLELLAQRFPSPDIPASIRKLPAPSLAPVAEAIGPAVNATKDATARLAGGNDRPEGATALAAPSAVATGARPAATPAPPPLLQPLAPDRYKVAFTASADTCEKLELARDLLRHALPSGDAALIFARALDALVEQLVKDKYAATARPRAGGGHAEDSRHIPAEVKRVVFIRDRGRCAFVSGAGRRCGERAFVEFHHVIPWAAGGRATVDNIQLRCRAHNGYEAEVFYGPARACVPGQGVRVQEGPEVYGVSAMTRCRSGTRTPLSGRPVSAVVTEGGGRAPSG